jgi:hypothetical protein
LKLLWALPLALDPARPPYPRHLGTDHWKIADALLYESGVPHRDLLAPARRVNLAVGCGVVLLAGWWAFRLWGSRAAGVAAAAFAAFDPNLLALSCVLSTDAGLSLFALLSAYLLWEHAGSPSRGLLVAAGVSLGLMLSAKFSALAVVAGLGLAGVIWARREKSSPSPLAGEGGRASRPGEGLGLPESGTSHPSPPAPLPQGERGEGSAFDLAFRLGLVALVTLAATYGFVNFGEWGGGLKFQLTRAAHGDGVMYLNGEVSRTGWYHYFAVVLLLKVPLGLLLAGGTGLLTCVPSAQVRRPVPRDAWLLVPPMVFLLAASASKVNLGVRVVLPVLPFAYVLAARLAAGTPWQRVALGVCVAWCGAASWRAAPHQLAYFNELGGGMANLADSNLDWGQGLPELKGYIDREGLGTIYLSYFGTDRPEAYGIRYQPLPGYGRAAPPVETTVPENEPRHVVAVSANHLLGLYLNDPDAFAWLRGRQPAAVLCGGCVHVFDLTGDAEAIRRVRKGDPVAR